MKAILEWKNKSVAVVGNSPCEIGKNKGKEIDQHDIVIRFNDFKISEEFKADYGKRTHIWVRGTNDKLVYTMEDKKKILLSFKGIFIRAFDKRNAEFRKYCEEHQIKPYHYPRRFEAALTKKLGHIPSTGLLTIFILHVFQVPFDLYGFSFCKENRNKDIRGGQIHYYNENNLMNPVTGEIERIKGTFLESRHAWEAEEKFYKEFMMGK